MKRIVILGMALIALLSFEGVLSNFTCAQSVGAAPPDPPVKLIFIHHSTGENWLTDGYGNLGRELANNNYFVSDTNYGWGPDGIGDRTDIINWREWFRGSETPRYTQALLNESEQHSSYTRTFNDPGGENQIVMFKSCFPNSALAGGPNDPPDPAEGFTVGHAKFVYNDLLDYFRTRPDKLFIVITAPPLQDPTYADNARAFNNWLVHDWLAENNYPFPNVAVFDFYNVLTHPSHHHWIRDGRIEHVSDGVNTLYYDSNGDDHPNVAGSQKATAEFIPLLNLYHHRFLTNSSPPETNRLMPGDFTYLGAFRLPGDETRPQTFAYGGNAMTFNPDGDPRGPADGFPGSLFVMGHDRIAYGTLPDGNQVAEISIPTPVISRNLEDLPYASFVQNFQEVVADYFHEMDEIPKVGLAYLNHPATGPKIHLTWGQHLQPENTPSQGWFNPTLTNPDFQGVWFIGNQNLYSVNGYLFEIPAAWADAHAQGRYLGTGRMRDGGQGGMGPTLFAYRPWRDDGTAPPSGTVLTETPLLLYENAFNTDQIVRAMNGYQHADEWEGGAWITTTAGQAAVLFAGTKSTGTKYWYGFMNPRGPAYPCVDQHVTDFLTCRLANGAACPPEDFAGCCDEALGNCLSHRGWWSTRFDAQFLLYDPADLARVAAGEFESWRPQPYATVDIDPYLYLNPPPWDEIVVGTGDQRRYRIGDVAYDRAHNLLYVLELFADGGKPVVHVWRVGGGGGDPVTTLITHYYVSILERTPEPDGLAFWQGLVAERQARGEDVKPVFRWMAEFFFFSPEYLGRHTTDRQFITNLVAGPTGPRHDPPSRHERLSLFPGIHRFHAGPGILKPGIDGRLQRLTV